MIRRLGDNPRLSVTASVLMFACRARAAFRHLVTCSWQAGWSSLGAPALVAVGIRRALVSDFTRTFVTTAGCLSARFTHPSLWCPPRALLARSSRTSLLRGALSALRRGPLFPTSRWPLGAVLSRPSLAPLCRSMECRRRRFSRGPGRASGGLGGAFSPPRFGLWGSSSRAVFGRLCRSGSSSRAVFGRLWAARWRVARRRFLPRSGLACRPSAETVYYLARGPWAVVSAVVRRPVFAQLRGGPVRPSVGVFQSPAAPLCGPSLWRRRWPPLGHSCGVSPAWVFAASGVPPGAPPGPRHGLLRGRLTDLAGASMGAFTPRLGGRLASPSRAAEDRCQGASNSAHLRALVLALRRVLVIQLGAALSAGVLRRPWLLLRRSVAASGRPLSPASRAPGAPLRARLGARAGLLTDLPRALCALPSRRSLVPCGHS